MSTTEALDQLFESVGSCLSADVAAKLQDLRVTQELQTLLDSWAEKNLRGELGADDRQQYEAILRALNFVAVLQAKARRITAASLDDR